MSKVLLGRVGVLALMALLAIPAVISAEELTKKHEGPQMGKLEEAEASGQIGEPNYGYVGNLGSFEVTTKGDAMGMIVVHNYPETTKFALGSTKLEFVGAKRIGDVDGWVFKTQWDGKMYPSKIFFSSEEVYFGGGASSYIVADYRDGTGWTWKLQSMRRMDIVQK